MSERGNSISSSEGGMSYSNEEYNSMENSPNQSTYSGYNEDGEKKKTSNKKTRKGKNSNSSSYSNGKPEDDKKKQSRRERNKIAAAKCRQKRLDLLKSLTEEVDHLKKRNAAIIKATDILYGEMEKLINILKNHVCHLTPKDRAALDNVITNNRFKAITEEIRNCGAFNNRYETTTDDNSSNNSSTISNHRDTNGQNNQQQLPIGDNKQNYNHQNSNYNSSVPEYKETPNNGTTEIQRNRVNIITEYIIPDETSNQKSEMSQHKRSHEEISSSEVNVITPNEDDIASKKKCIPRPSSFLQNFHNAQEKLPQDTICDNGRPFFENNFNRKYDLYTLGNDVTGLTPVANNVQFPTLDTPTPMGEKDIQML
uniref:BZIP domain-containing protein n=1 Tax=Parastrongyloides trichosuri TaxID=131310 RepID=A0A0N4Z966_PARTI